MRYKWDSRERRGIERQKEKEKERERDLLSESALITLQFAYLEKLISKSTLEAANIMYTMCKGIPVSYIYLHCRCTFQFTIFFLSMQAFLIFICTRKLFWNAR